MEADDSAISADASTFSVCLGVIFAEFSDANACCEKAHLFFYLTPFFLVSVIFRIVRHRENMLQAFSFFVMRKVTRLI